MRVGKSSQQMVPLLGSVVIEDDEMRVVSPIDPLEGQIYVKPVYIEGKGEYLDQIYNSTALKDDYINRTVDGNLSWRSNSSCTSYSGEALENWKNRSHEVSMQRRTRVTHSVRRVGNQLRELPTYEGLPNLVTFVSEFEGKVT